LLLNGVAASLTTTLCAVYVRLRSLLPAVQLKKQASYSWRHMAKREMDELEAEISRGGDDSTDAHTDRPSVQVAHILGNREKLLVYPVVPPWCTDAAEQIEIYPHLLSQCSREDSDLVRRQATELTLFARGSFDLEIWTDGSVGDGRIGAGAALIFEGVTEIGSAGAPSGQLSTSYRAEGVALFKGLCALSKKKGKEGGLVGKRVLVAHYCRQARCCRTSGGSYLSWWRYMG
jgi:hypothetical protein